MTARSKITVLSAVGMLMGATGLFLGLRGLNTKPEPPRTTPAHVSEAAPIRDVEAAQDSTPSAHPTPTEKPSNIPPQADNLAAQQQELEAAQEQAAEESRKRIMERLENNLNQHGMNQIIAEQQRVLMVDQFSDLARKLNLSPEEAQYFFDLITERQMVRVEMGMKLMTGALTPEERSQLIEKVVSGTALINEEIDRFLNNANDSEYFRYYEQTEHQRSAVRTIAAELDSDTEEELVNLLFNEANSVIDTFPQGEDGALDPTQLSLQDISDLEQMLIAKTPEVLQQGAATLSPAQLPQLESAYQQYISSLKNQLQMVHQLFQSN